MRVSRRKLFRIAVCDFYSFTADFVIYVCMCVCVCVISLKFCIVLFHARQILMPQPILIAPRGPHRFIPSGEGASPSPFGPLNARGCVHEPPCGGPPWPPLLPGPRKRKISLILSYIPVFVVSELFFSKRFAHIPRTYVYIYACLRLFVDVSHLFLGI